MKRLILDERVLYYNICEVYDYCGYYDIITKFYCGTKTVPKWRFLFLKSKQTKEIPKYVFTIYENIESSNFNKEYVKALIRGKLTILKREEEIERGELIWKKQM